MRSKTRWSVVGSAGEGSPQALEALCSAYWYPFYAYVRRRGLSAEDAQDRVQGFFVELLRRGDLADVVQERGRFRGWLLTAMRHSLGRERARAQAQKRGAGALAMDWGIAESRYQLEDPADAERLYQHKWSLALLDRAMSGLEAEYTRNGASALFARIRPVLTEGALEAPYSQVAEELEMSQSALKVAIHRLRKRYQQQVRAEVADTVARPEDVDDELRVLMQALQ